MRFYRPLQVRRAAVAVAMSLSVSGLTVLAPPMVLRAGADPGSVSFSYQPGAQQFVVPAGVTAVSVDVAGGQGGGGTFGGLGGRVRATLAVVPGDVLQVYVGDAGGLNTAGGNGGGTAADGAFGGGGASDIRKNGVGLADRVVVAGGGGGAGKGASSVTGTGGSGGSTGTNGTGCAAAGGASQTAGGALGGGDAGYGGAGDLGQGGFGKVSTGNWDGGGGGGGYYGGGGAGACYNFSASFGGGGGGGSSWAAAAASAVRFDQGVHVGAGSVTISWPPTTPAPVTPAPGSMSYTTPGGQFFTVPDGVSAVAVDLAGAQGGGDPYAGLGGRVRATIAVSPGDVLEVNVGDVGGLNAAGGNGGGSAGDGAFGGGGASDIRKNGVGLADRVVVAGGGGGAGKGASSVTGTGGSGGSTGTNGTGCAAAGGASQTAGGALGGGDAGFGGAGDLGQGGFGKVSTGNWDGGGGGGGYYGGGGGGACYNFSASFGGGGGGGSSWAAAAASAVRSDQGVHLGAGSVTISWPPATPAPVNATPGSVQYTTPGTSSFVVPAGVAALSVTASGAQGGGGIYGGLGGRVQATVAVSPGDVLQVNVGGAGDLNTAGSNGGGTAADGAFGGGGASDIRKNGAGLDDRIVVAAGGGGAGKGAYSVAGSGGAGGPTGLNGTGCSAAGGATQTAGGALGGGDAGYGGAGTLGQGGFGKFSSGNWDGGGGGGGYYGGGGAGACYSFSANVGGGGGGGSSWVSPLVGLDGTLSSAMQSGNGQVTISWPAPRDASRSFGIDSYGEFVNQVFLGSGNLVEQATDAKVDTAGPDLALSRTYNSLDSTTGWFGVGWSSTYEELASADPITGDVTIRYPDGRKETHHHNANGSFTAPAGYVSTLTNHAGGGWDLRQKDRSSVTFDAQGHLAAMTDRYGRSLTFAYGGGQLGSITDPASARTLTFTWNGSHVDTVSTNAVAGPGYNGPLTWRYVYSGDLLTKVCDPRNNDPVTGMCTSYGYTGGKLTSITRPKGNTSLTAAYKADGRVDWTQNGVGDQIHYNYYDGVSSVTDGRGYTSYYFYDPLYRTTLLIDPAGGLTSYTYDANGFRSKVTDPNGNTVSLAYDARGNLTSQTNGEGETTWFSYDASDNLVAKRDGRSSGPTDDRYKTSYTYNSAGDKLTETSPPTAEYASGVPQTWTYTAGGENLGFGAGVPAGLLRTFNNGLGTTTYSYDPTGDLRLQTDPSGLQHRLDRDSLGRVTTDVLTSDGGQTATTTRTWDQLGDPLVVTEPAVTNTAVTPSVMNQKQTTVDYDANGNAWRTTVHDAGGSTSPTPDRVTTVDFDNADRPWRTTDAEGGITTKTFDGNGNVATVTDAEGRTYRTDYDERNRPTTVTLLGFVDDPIAGSTPRDVVVQRTEYDAAGRKTAQYTPRADTGGRAGQLDPGSTPMAKRRYLYDKADRVLSVTFEAYADRSGATRDIVLEADTYDHAGNKTTVTQNSGLSVTTNTYDEAGRLQTATLGMGTVNRVADFDYDPAGNVTRQTTTQGSSVVETRAHYDSAGRPDSKTVENGTTDLTTTFGYDQRGLPLWTVDPRGNVTGANPADYRTDDTYDAAGRLVQEQAPPVSIEAVGGTAVTGRPTTKYGYDAVGNEVAAVDPRGALTRQTFDRLDRRTRIDHPAYTPPGGTQLTPFEAYSYDRVGNLTSSTDRRNQVTDYLFDARNRVVRQLDPQLAGQPARGATLFSYDDAGNRVSQTDPTGAVTTVAYDDLNRPRTKTAVVRQDAPAGSFTTTFDYDDAGNQTYLSDPTGVYTATAYDAAGEPASVTDALNKTSTYSYDAAGRRTAEVDPLGRRVEHNFDQAGRETSTVWKDPSTGSVLATEYRTFDPAGNLIADRSPRSASATDDTYKTAFVYDAANQRTSVTEPDATAPMTTSYGHDAAGNTTRVTDGRNNVTTYTYTPWNTPESTIEPSTPGQTATVDRTFTLAYDAGGLPVTETQPGVTISRTFDAMGRLTADSGTGTGVTSATRAFGYDLAGRRTSMSHPSGTIGLTYDDRSLLLSSTVPGSAQTASSFRYDGAGRLTSRTDAAGTTTFSYTPRGELDVASDPLTGKTANYDWNDAGQVAQVTYGTNPATTRTYGYDPRGRLSDDSLTAGATTLAAAHYVYDAEGNVTAQTITAPGNPAAGASGYTYDPSGRLDTWTAPGGAVTDYAYDAAGNRTGAGSTVSAYDARNRITSQTAFDTTAPTVPGGVTATAVGARQVNLIWTASTDASGVAGYTVLRNGLVIGTATGTAFSDTTATKNTAYTYTVEAYDAAGNRSSPSTGAAATTPAVSTIVVRGSATTAAVSGGTSLSINRPSGTAAGDVLVASLSVSGNPTITASGWTQQISTPNSTTMKVVTYTRLAGTETGPYTFTFPTSSVSGAIVAYGGASPYVPKDIAGGQSNAKNSNVIAPSVTTTGATDRLVGAFGTATQATFTPASGMTEQADVAVTTGTTKTSLEVADQALTATGATGTRAAVPSANAVNAGQVLALRPAGAEPADSTVPTAPGTPTATAGSGPVQVGLTWTAGTDDIGVVGYRINRGGTLIGYSATTSFTDTKVSANTAYSYTVETVDEAGNRSAASGAANITTGAGYAGTVTKSYSWSPRGTLSTVTAGTTTPVAFDGLGRQITWGATNYTYDALDRIATSGATSFTYAGTSTDPSTAGTQSYSRTPAGDLLAVKNGSSSALAGENRHGDLAWLLGSNGTVTDTRIWDPYGQLAGATGSTNPSVGYQGDYTDPASGDVWMGARWYQPDTGSFTSRDTVFGMLKTPISLNRYTYAAGDPMQYFDPDGHMFSLGDAWSATKHAASSAWDNTGGKIVTAVNDDIVQPVMHVASASANAASSIGSTAKRTVGNAVSRSTKFVQQHAKTIVRTGVTAMAGGAAYLACTGTSLGAGAVTGCGAVAGAVAGVVNAAFDCPGTSMAQCAKGMVVQGAAGAAAGAAFGGLLGGDPTSASLLRTIGAGFGGGVTHSATSQYLTTGGINARSAITEGLIGGATAGALHGAGAFVRSVRGAPASAMSEGSDAALMNSEGPVATEAEPALAGGQRFGPGAAGVDDPALAGDSPYGEKPVRRVYEPNPKHGEAPYVDSQGRVVSRAPSGDCQAILDCSIPKSANSPHRVGVEPDTGLPVELRRHLVQEFDDEVVEYFHGYVPGG